MSGRQLAPRGLRRSTLTRVSLTLVLPVVALLPNEWLRPQLDPAFEPTMTAAVALVCWLCGPLYATAALTFSALLFIYFFLPPYYSPTIADLNSALRFCFFLGANALVVGLIANLYNTQAALARSERIYRNLAELIPFGGWIADDHGEMIHLSDSFLSTFGLTASEALGMGWTKAIVEEQRALVLQEWKACVRDGYFWDFEYRMTSRSGEPLTVLSRGVPVSDGEHRTWVGMHLDVTAREHAVEEQVRQARDIARFNAELEQLAYVSAHDLQEPLRIIASYLQLLQRRYRGKLDAEADEYIGFAVEGAARLRCLLQDLLQLQSVGKSGRQRKRQQLRNVVERAVRNIGPVDADITVGDLPDVVCDDHEFVLLFEHLIGNALKYARQDTRPRVHIAAESAPGGHNVVVTDNGIGIPPEYRYRVFDVFQRLHPRAEHPGTGIGLSVCRKIVEVHGGRIWAEGNPEGGSRFCFFVPAA